MSEKDKYPSELAERFQIRLPPGLRDRIRAIAEANGRSMNTEIVSTLEEAYPDPVEYRENLGFLDEIESIQRSLERVHAAALSDAGRRYSEEFMERRQEKSRSKQRPRPGTIEDES